MTYKELLNSLSMCPFCEFKDRVIAENTSAILTYAIAPYHPDHLLVIPRKHIEHITEISPVTMSDINEMQNTAIKILKKLGHTNICLLVKEGDVTEKSISHTHYHVIPDILLESSDHLGFERKVITAQEIKVLMDRIDSVKSSL